MTPTPPVTGLVTGPATGPTDRAAIVAAAHASIVRGSKSFAAASTLFDHPTRERAWLLYAWCRRCDDIADGQDHGHGMTRVSDAPARLAEVRAKTEAALAGEVLPRTFVEWIGRHNVILDEIARLKNPADCVPFVWHGSLWLHHPSWNEIRGWKLEDFA